jgi:hypothetical protein
MQALERRYAALGLGAAIVMAALILGYRIVISDPYSAPYAGNDKANHHPRSAAAADQPGVSN